MIVEIITAIAAALTQGASFPQTIRTIRTRSTKALSLTFILMLISGLTTWEIYGVVTHQPVFLIGNTFGLAFWITILTIKSYNMGRGLD